MEVSMDKDEKRILALGMLEEKYKLLGTLPKRSDFTPQEACFIKQKLGPWPRALEAAGLKAPPEISSKEKSRLKRERSRARRQLYREQNGIAKACKNEEEKT